MELLRFATAGSVDDGKSTLIGRLLYDSKQIFEDTLDAIEHSSRLRGEEGMNLALLTDGLRAEREQGITIDVAYRYFATPDPQVHHRRHARPHSVHAQHGHRRVDRRPRADPRRRPQRHHRAVAAARVPRVAARRAAPRAVRQQDGPRRLRPGGLRAHPARVPRVRGQARRARPHVHPDLGAARATTSSSAPRTCRGTRARRCCTSSKTCTSPRTATSSTAGSRCSTSSGPATTASTTTAATRARSSSGTYKRGRRGRRAAVGLHVDASRRSTPPTARSKRPTPPMSVTIRLEDDLDVSRGDMICRPHNRPAGRPGHRRDGLLVQRPRASSRPGAKYAIKHTSKWARALVKDLQYRLDVNTLHRDEDGDVALAQRDRPRHAAHDAAAVLRRVPPQPRHRLVHPRRRSDQRHPRRRHDPRPARSRQ